jgi:D-threonate/D-erythronate kinase
MRILGIADDTTGDIEVGAKFAMAGVSTLVSTGNDLESDRDGLVVDAHTRHLSPRQARERILRLAGAAIERGVSYLFKKTDSTLRGHIAVEFQALIEVFPERPLLYVPAYPQMGRTVRDGELYVHGVPLAETVFAADRLNPSLQGWIPGLLSAGCGAPVLTASTGERILELLAAVPGGVIIICDGTTEDDLRSAAEALASSARDCIVAGTAGFCEPWVSALPMERTFRGKVPAVRRCLVVGGSLHPASSAAILRAAESGIPAIVLADEAAGDDLTAAGLAEALSAHSWVSLTTAGTCPGSVVQRMGALAARAIEMQPVDGVAVFGGDTTLGVLDALGSSVVEPIRDLLPGVPVSLIQHGDRRLALIAKAGGFGDAGTLLSIRETLEGGS